MEEIRERKGAEKFLMGSTGKRAVALKIETQETEQQVFRNKGRIVHGTRVPRLCRIVSVKNSDEWWQLSSLI